MTFSATEIEKLVRQAVIEHLANSEISISDSIFNEEIVRKISEKTIVTIPPGTIVTPLARQIAMERKIRLIEGETQPVVEGTGINCVAFGADHGGFALKEQLKKIVLDAGYKIIDCGTHSTDAVDYPDFAYAVARLVADGKAQNGIVIDGAGIGSCMVANKVPGVRAAMCYDQSSAINSREHNHANVLTLGAGMIGSNLAKQITLTWLQTEWGPGRHARRVEKIEQIGRRYQK